MKAIKPHMSVTNFKPNPATVQTLVLGAEQRFGVACS